MRLTFALLLAAATLCSAQPLSYTLLNAEGTKPSPRFDGTIAYDPTGRQIFLFGGSDGVERNDLWTYSLTQRRWTEIQASGERPPARFGHTLLFDPVRRRLVVFGGQAGGFFSDTWAFDIAAGSWQQVSADESGPSRRYGHSAIYDAARDRMIVSHGFTNAGRFDDTWAFELATNTWRNVSPPSGRPLRRCLHHAVYDSANNQMLLYGGCASGAGPCPLGDLWSFDLTAHRWTEIASPTTPAPRDHYGIVFDDVRERVLLFGGSGGGPLNDTWAFDTRARAWRQPALAGPSPGARSRHESAYAPDRGNAYFFGGVTAAGPSNELWMLGPGFIASGPQLSREGVVNAFSGIGGALAPGELISIYGSGFTSPVAVTFDGQPATLYYADVGQVNVQVPGQVQINAETILVVSANGNSSAPLALTVVRAHPGLFPRVFHPDGSTNSRENRAPAGSIVVLYATGDGVEPAAQTSVTIGGRTADIVFRGDAPGTTGVVQVNARIPDDSPAGEAAVSLTIDGAASQPGVTVHVGPHL